MTTTIDKNASQSKGLAGMTAGDTAVCSIEDGGLFYRGYDVAELAKVACFEEIAFLLLVGHKPSGKELDAFKSELTAMRDVPGWILDVVRNVAPDSHPMDTLRTGVSLLSHIDPDRNDHSLEACLRKSKRLLAAIPTLIGAGQRAIDGKPNVSQNTKLSHAANLIYQITGNEPDEMRTKTMDVSLILYAEHEFNASTFTARIISSTLSDLHSAVVGAIGALRGPLHGGANEQAIAMVQEVGSYENIRPFMDEAFASKRKIMGFGHRVYKDGDHRAPILHEYGRKIASGDAKMEEWFRIGEEIQRIMLDEKGIHPSVDFPCGLTYFAAGIPIPQYTPIFVASRVTGWCAHIMEQTSDNRLIRPLSNYTGPGHRRWSDD